MKNLIKLLIDSKFGSWGEDDLIQGQITICKKRLKKLINLEKTIKKYKNIKPKQETKYQTIELEAEVRSKLLKLYLPKIKQKKGKKGKLKTYLPKEIKSIIKYARETELKYKKYIGAEADFFIADKLKEETK